MSPVVELLRELIAIPSVNPEGDSGCDEHAGEQRIAEFVGAFLRTLGAEVQIEEVLPGRPNVIGKFPSERDGSPAVLLAPHLDTVTVKGMRIDPFGGAVDEGRIYGRGASDTKGTMAAMLTALQETRDDLPRLGAEITFVGFMGEEHYHLGSRHFAAHHDPFDFAVVGEPTGCEVVYATKGNYRAKLTTSGRAAHSSNPSRGENAVLKMARVVSILSDELPPQLADSRFSHPDLGGTTMNIGMIRGGEAPNIVPNRCELWLDLRPTPALHEYGAERLLREAVEHAGLADDVSIETAMDFAPLDGDRSHPLVAKLCGDHHGCAGASWYCDAAPLAAGGTPAVAAGPGDMAQAHTAEESIGIEELEQGVTFYRDFLLRL